MRIESLYAISPSCPKNVNIRLPGEGNSNSHGARPVHQKHIDDQMDSDQWVVNKELSLRPAHLAPAPVNEEDERSSSPVRIDSLYAISPSCQIDERIY